MNTRFGTASRALRDGTEPATPTVAKAKLVEILNFERLSIESGSGSEQVNAHSCAYTTTKKMSRQASLLD